MNRMITASMIVALTAASSVAWAETVETHSYKAESSRTETQPAPPPIVEHSTETRTQVDHSTGGVQQETVEQRTVRRVPPAAETTVHQKTTETRESTD